MIRHAWSFLIVLALLQSLPAVGSQGHTRCLTWEIPALTGVNPGDLQLPEAGRDLPCDHTPVGPPANPQVGDSWNWYIWSLNGMPTSSYESCTVRGAGEHHYVVVQDTAWNASIDQTDVNAIVDAVEESSIGMYPDQGIWDLNTSHFGDPPDNLDQDGKIYLLYYEFDVSADGYFWIFDQSCDGDEAWASNECDVIYLNTVGSPPAGDFMLAVVAHEFQHLIHFEQDQDEASWVDEGCGELAMWLYGHPDNVSMFPGNPDNSLTVWNGNWSDYIKTYLWTLYFYEQYGGQASIFDLVHQPANGTAGYQAALTSQGYTESFADVFADWGVANYLDDPTIGDGRYGYNGEDLPAFHRWANFDTYPVSGQTGTVSHWGTDYMGFTQGEALDLDFDGADSGSFAVHGLTLDSSGLARVARMDLSAAQSGSLGTFGDLDDPVVMVVGKTSSSGGRDYQFGAMEGSPVTPTPEPTAEPSATPIPGDEPWIDLDLNGDVFAGGDLFLLSADWTNPLATREDVQTYIVLEVLQDYWLWPSWRSLDEGIDFAMRDLNPTSVATEEILRFDWPHSTGSMVGLWFHAILLSQDGVEVLGELSSVRFSFDD